MRKMVIVALVFLIGCQGTAKPPEPELTAISTATAVATPTMAPDGDLPTLPATTPSPQLDQYAEQREQMVVQTIESRDIGDERVLRAMRTVPRHLFVSANLYDRAYGDYPLPIGYGQTISQPYIVALMTELLALQEGERVLEIGTGSGYQAAVLAEIPGVEVYTVEIIPQLSEMGCVHLQQMGYTGVHCQQGDGYYGWPEAAPFNAIIVTAAPDHVPRPLIEQLADGGRLVIPIGPPGSYQTLWKFVKTAGELKAYDMGGVAFVPFTGEGLEKGRASGEETVPK